MVKLLILTYLGALIPGASLILALLQPERRLTLADIERVQVGMSHAEVVNLLGRPGIQIDVWEQEKSPKLVVWLAEDKLLYALNVSLDMKGRVTQVVALPGWRRGIRQPPGILERIRRLIEH